MKKFTLSIFIVSLLSGCSTTIPKDQLHINIKSSNKSNNGNNYLVVYQQPSSMDQMAHATYDTLSQQVLDSNYQTKLVHPQNEVDTVVFKTQDEPGAIYFILNNKNNYNTWKYYIPAPSGGMWDCLVDENSYINCKDSEK
ncbi:type VI secretion system lipoprotein IglE [Francisella philomiragia]|uniref:type VI secretion system lipoprotein IglE n=1 Tax=Francisella philomiragia TaxID=28110 RepID=UPI00351163C5